ncbi:MAG: hypothetical protein ABIH08_07810 [Candidatus Omnitrophota bacterium]
MKKDQKHYKKFPINKTLIWDYDLEGKYDTEEFKKWYISRVLNCGTKKDIRQVGIGIIRQYFPNLNLSNKIRQFWEWYFDYAYTH